MSNLSDIGFPTPDETAINEMIIHVLEVARPVKNPHGFYLIYSDPSGAEIFMQGNFEQELVGFNPHFAGEGRISVELTAAIERDSSDFDGGFRAIAGANEFVFDAPDFRMVEEASFPRPAEVQLTAFASNDFKINDSGALSGSFTAAPSPDPELPPRPVASFAATVTASERRRNDLSGEEFFYLKADSAIGPVDIVSDPKWIVTEIKPGDTVSGTFWLSGRV